MAGIEEMRKEPQPMASLDTFHSYRETARDWGAGV